jgi:hypothetical protein
MVSIAAVIFEVIRYQGMCEDERHIDLFTLNYAVGCCTIPAVPAGIAVFLYFLLRPDPKRGR